MSDLRTDYTDDQLDSSVNTNRTFSIIDNETGTVIYPNVSLEETTVFTRQGDSHTASITNQQNAKINELSSEVENMGMKVIARGTINATTTVTFPNGINVDPSKYYVSINTNGYYNAHYIGGGNAYAPEGYGIGAWDTDHTSTSIKINVSTGITCTYTVIQIAN